MAAKCKKFEANIFNKNKCGVCFKSKHEHSAAALECSKAARKISKCGYLFIAPDLSARRWQRRFFILYDDGELTYSVDENVGTVPQGVMDMNVCEDVFDAEEQSSHEFSIAIVVPQKTYFVKGTSKEEINRWHDVLVMYPRSMKSKHKRTLPPTPTTSQKKPVEISPSYSQPLPTPTHKPLTLSYSHPITTSGATRPLLSSTRFVNSFDHAGVSTSQSAPASTLQSALAAIREPVPTGEPYYEPIPTSPKHQSPPDRSPGYNSREQYLNSSLPPERSLGYGIQDQYPNSSSPLENTGFKRTKSDHGLNDILGGAAHPTPVSYRGVRSLKHKHDDRYHEGMRKSNSLHDLPSTSSSQDDLTDKFLSKDWYKASPNGLGSTSLSPQNFSVSKNKLGRAKSFSSPATNYEYESEKPKTLYHSLLEEQMNPKPQSSYYAKIAGVPKSKVYDSSDRQRAHERRKTQPEIRYLEANRADREPLQRRSSFQGEKQNGRDLSPPDTVFKYGRRGLESLANEYGSMPQSPEKKKPSSPGKESPKKSDPSLQVAEQRSDDDGEVKEAEDATCLKKGWLHKQGPSDKEWTKYWFVLHGEALKYFKDSRAEELNTLDGRIDLSYCYEVTDIDATKNYGFKVRTRNGSYILSAMTSGIRNNWVQALTKYVRKPGSNVSSPAQSENQSPKTTRSGARLRRTLPNVGSKSVPENNSPSDFNRRNTVDVVKLEQPPVTDPNKSPTEKTESTPSRRRSERLSERLSERRMRRSSGATDSGGEKPSRRARTLRQSQVDETSSCGSQTSIPEVAPEEVVPLLAAKTETVLRPKPSPKHDSARYHRHDRRSESSRFRARHHSSGSEYGSNDSLSLPKESNPETRLLAKSPIEKKLDKLRSKSSRVKSPPPPSSDDQVMETSVRSGSSTDERAVVELLETEVESLQNQLERAQNELLSVHKDNVNLKTQIRLKKEKEKEEEDVFDGDDDDDVRLIEKCNMLEIRIGELELENTSQINENATLDTKLDRLKKENDQLMNSIQGLKQDNSELKKQLRLSGSESGDLQKELESLKNDMLKIKDVQESKSNEMAETQQKLEEYRTDSRKKKRQVREKEDQISEMEEQVEKKNAELDRLSKRYENILGQLEEKTSLLELNRVDSKVMKERDGQLTKVQAELDRRTRECADLMNKYNAVGTEVQDVRAALEASERKHNQQSDSLHTRDEVVDSLNAELSKLKREFQTVERQSNDMSKELQDTKTTLRDSLQILDSQKSRVDEKDEQIHDLKKQLEKRNYDYEDACVKCEDLTSELERAKTALEDHEEELDHEKAESDEKEAEIEDLKLLVDKKSGDCDMLLNKYNELLAEYDDAKAGLESSQEMALLDQLEEKEEDIHRLREDLEDRTEDCEDLSDRIDDLEHQLVDAKAALVEAEHRANRQQTKERKTESVDVSTETDFDIPSMTVLPVKMDQIVQTFFVEQKQSRSLDSNFSSDVSIIKSLRSKVKENQDKCDDLDFMNIKLTKKIKALMEQYDGEIKFYGVRIDDLVEKLRQEQIKKRKKQELGFALKGGVVYSNEVEKELLLVEQKIEQAENEFKEQEITTEALENQIGSVESKLSNRKDDDEGMSSQEEGSCSSDSSPVVGERERNSRFEPVSLFQDGQDYDNNNSNQFFSRIQGLHDKVAQSNAKLKEVLGMLDESQDEDEDDDGQVSVASQEQTHAVQQRLLQCEKRLENITSRLQSNEASFQSSRAPTPPIGNQALRSVISTHETTLSILQDCRSRLSESLHGLEAYDNADVVSDCLEQIRETVTDMIQHAQSEELAIKDTKTKLLRTLETSGEDGTNHLEKPEEFSSRDRPRTPDVVKKMKNAEKLDMYAENIALKSLIGGEASYVNQHWREEFIRERDQYFEELRLATERIGELEDTIDYLTESLEQEQSRGERLQRHQSLDSYASLFSESMIHHGIAVSKLQSIEQQRENERNRMLAEVQELNEKIANLEDALHKRRNEKQMHISSNSHSGRSVPELATVLSENITLEAQKSALMQEYQESMFSIREQQVKEFKLFHDRIQSMESKISELSDPSNASQVNSIDNPLIKAAISRSQSEVGAKLESLLPQSVYQEDWGVYSQATSLVSKAMSQAELTVRINRLRDSLVNCTTKQEQLRVLDQEMDLAQTKLRSREKLMTEMVDNFKEKKINDLAQLISSNTAVPLSPVENQFENGSIDDLWTQIETRETSSVQRTNYNRVLSKLLAMVTELAGFYKTLDMVGESSELQAKLEAAVQQEVEVLTEELLLKCEETMMTDQPGIITEELMHNMVYNLADILAQRAMIEAQFQYISDLQQKYKDEREMEIPPGLETEDFDSASLPDATKDSDALFFDGINSMEAIINDLPSDEGEADLTIDLISPILDVESLPHVDFDAEKSDDRDSVFTTTSNSSDRSQVLEALKERLQNVVKNSEPVTLREQRTSTGSEEKNREPRSRERRGRSSTGSEASGVSESGSGRGARAKVLDRSARCKSTPDVVINLESSGFAPITDSDSHELPDRKSRVKVKRTPAMVVRRPASPLRKSTSQPGLNMVGTPKTRRGTSPVRRRPSSPARRGVSPVRRKTTPASRRPPSPVSSAARRTSSAGRPKKPPKPLQPLSPIPPFPLKPRKKIFIKSLQAPKLPKKMPPMRITPKKMEDRFVPSFSLHHDPAGPEMQEMFK